MRRAFYFAALTLLFGACSDRSVVDLTGKWRYRMGFETAYLASREDPAWKEIALPAFLYKTLNLQDYRGWITLQKDLPSSMSILEETPGLVRMGWNSDVAVFYIDDQRIGQTGSVEPYESGAYRPSAKTFSVLSHRDTHTVTMALYTNGQFPLQVFGPEMEIGPADVLRQRMDVAQVISFSFLAIYFIVGAYHLLLFSVRRRDRHNLFFGIFCMLLTVYWFFRTDFRGSLFGSNVLYQVKTEYSTLFMIGPSMIFFLSQYFEKKFSRIGIVVTIFWTGLLLWLLSATAYQTTADVLRVWQLTALPTMLFVVFYMGREAFRGNRDARWMLAGFVVFFLFVLHDLLSSLFQIDTPHLARYSFIIFVLGIAGVLARRFTRIHNQVEELNEHLEEKVRERTDQLHKTLHAVEELKVQQDGDYFLTSLLIQPLTGNFVEGSAVSVDIVARQKKQFRFKHWEAEIGGDLATANVITLRGRRYAVFINGDAMGKSIQGAGGALVLGTVFKSILSRTQVSSYFQNRYPEQWLKEMFLELQSVFTAFDGSMMVSAVFGLVSEESGLVYYVNAEHPFVVLYRRGKASFLDRSMELRKLGIAIIPGILQVRSVPLRPRDVLIIGSDGRDDVAIGEDSLGNRIINEDESHFLRSVEKGDGNLERIEEAIRETGELTDDLSLMRIAFRDDVPLTEESSVDQARDRIAVARAHARSGRLRQAEEDYRAAAESSPGPAIGREWLKVLHAMGRESERAEIAERYSELHPEVPGFLRVASEALAACGNIEKAVDFGERYRLCQPYNRAGLLHLVDLHMRQGRWTAALRVVEQRLIVDPMDREALELRLLLRQKMGSDDA